MKRKFIEFLKSEFFFESDNLKMDNETKRVISIIFNWVLGLPNGIYEPMKGFILTGTYGTGKSSIMKATIKLIFDMYGVSEHYPNGIHEPKYISGKQLARLFMDSDSVKINELIYTRLIGIDDFGYESKSVKSFGTVVYPFEEIIMERYDRKKIVLATTNLTPALIEQTYGGHVLDRLKQMCFWLEINSPSKRR